MNEQIIVKGMSKTDHNIQDIRLVRNVTRVRVSARIISLITVGKGHLLWSTQQGVMGILILQTAWCHEGSKVMLYGRGSNNEPGRQRLKSGSKHASNIKGIK